MTPTKTWAQLVEDNFNQDDFNAFNDCFELRSISYCTERMRVGPDLILFDDVIADGDVEDVILHSKEFNRESGNTKKKLMVTFRQVSDYDALVFALLTTAKSVMYDKDKLMEDILEDETGKYSSSFDY